MAPALAAAQGVCGNDTARAAEIPPPDIGWKVEQLVRDNQWRSIAAQRAGGRRGGGAAVLAGVGTYAAEVRQHTDPKRGHSGTWAHTDTQSVQGWATMGHCPHSPHGVTAHYNSL